MVRETTLEHWNAFSVAGSDYESDDNTAAKRKQRIDLSAKQKTKPAATSVRTLTDSVGQISCRCAPRKSVSVSLLSHSRACIRRSSFTHCRFSLTAV